MKKFTYLLTVLLLLTTVSVAQTTSGTCGANVTWELNSDTGVLTISGNGDMYNYNSGESPFYNNKEDIKEVIITDSVTSIGDYAFLSCFYCEQWIGWIRRLWRYSYFLGA